MTLEIAAFDLGSALVAADAGADRIELCRDAEAGGLTPPPSWTEHLAATTDVPVVVMIRAHAEGWAFSDAEHTAMREAARQSLDAGAAGVVWGALRADGTVDEPALRALIETAAHTPSCSTEPLTPHATWTRRWTCSSPVASPGC